MIFIRGIKCELEVIILTDKGTDEVLKTVAINLQRMRGGGNSHTVICRQVYDLCLLDNNSGKVNRPWRERCRLET